MPAGDFKAAATPDPGRVRIKCYFCQLPVDFHSHEHPALCVRALREELVAKDEALKAVEEQRDSLAERLASAAKYARDIIYDY